MADEKHGEGGIKICIYIRKQYLVYYRSLRQNIYTPEVKNDPPQAQVCGDARQSWPEKRSVKYNPRRGVNKWLLYRNWVSAKELGQLSKRNEYITNYEGVYEDDRQ